MVRKLRTAVLVVHGMGSQRPLDTVRGVINAVWFDNDDHSQDKVHKLWSHPEPSGVDLDLTVMTTNEIAATSGERSADFHELYWAHLMSETKAVAVLLWLFELARRGPYFKSPSMNALWWCGAIYLCLLLLSVAVVVLRAITWLAEIVAEPQDVLLTLCLMLSVALIMGALASTGVGWWRLLRTIFLAIVWWAAAVALSVAVVLLYRWLYNKYAAPDTAMTIQDSARVFGCVVLPIGSTFLATRLLMKKWGVRAFSWTLLLSFMFYAIYMTLAYLGCFGKEETLSLMLFQGRIPWSMCSKWSAVAAWLVIAVYLLINAAFLQPYLGDAARYFRNSPANVAVRRKIRKDAVDTLDQLHRSRDYDRIVVVAHSLGTVVAYDMLRAYYSRVCSQIPAGETELKPAFKDVETSTDCVSIRRQGRALVKEMARTSKLLDENVRQDPYRPAVTTEVDAWLVTDFVTLGSPLTHARYLMVNEDDGQKIEQDFWCRVRERELLLCPPHRQDSDGLISYLNHGKPALHHGGLFAITRWTNLYFPVLNIFWGDAIGGPVSGVFGGCIADIPVWTASDKTTDGFKHIAYWKTDCPEERDAPHIRKLRSAIDLADTGDVNKMGHP